MTKQPVQFLMSLLLLCIVSAFTKCGSSNLTALAKVKRDYSCILKVYQKSKEPVAIAEQQELIDIIIYEVRSKRLPLYGNIFERAALKFERAATSYRIYGSQNTILVTSLRDFGELYSVNAIRYLKKHQYGKSQEATYHITGLIQDLQDISDSALNTAYRLSAPLLTRRNQPTL